MAGTDATTDATTGAETGGDSGVQPPEPGPMNAPDGDGSVVFAVDRFFLGDTDFDGTPNPASAWKQYGYDLDGKVTVAGSNDHCKPRQSAPAAIFTDGDDGIDNSFGKSILPVLSSLASDVTAVQNMAVDDGKYTLLFDIDKLGSGADYNPLLTRHYAGGSIGMTPKWDGTDEWPLTDLSLNDPLDAATPKVLFADSYLVGDVWVGRAAEDAVVPLDIVLLDVPVRIGIRRAIITMELDPAHARVTRGILAGVVPALELAETLRQASGVVAAELCSGPLIESVLVQTEQAADIRLDGAVDPELECDAISIGVGFTAATVKLGTIVAGAPPAMGCG